MMSKANHWLGCNQALCGRIFRRTSPIKDKVQILRLGHSERFCVENQISQSGRTVDRYPFPLLRQSAAIVQCHTTDIEPSFRSDNFLYSVPFRLGYCS